MAIAVTFLSQSPPNAAYVYNVTGLVQGANVITLPTPPASGSFPPTGEWTPVGIECESYNTGAIGALVTPDLSTISQAAGVVSFTVYSAGATNCQITVW